MRHTRVADLFKALREKLSLTHVSGDLSHSIRVTEEHVWAADLVGHLNLIHPTRTQVVGAAELAWAQRQPVSRTARYLSIFAQAQSPLFIVADDMPIPLVLREMSERTGIALLSSPSPSASVIDLTRIYLSRELAERTELHGVFMDVFGLGVFITGDSGAGKSELALELISRGSGLVADDVVGFSRVAPTVIEGCAPALLKDVIEVRGLGVLNIRTIFGETACRRKMRLRLVVHMMRNVPGQPEPARLSTEQAFQEVLGVPIPQVTLPVAAGRNLAVLLEAAVRAAILKMRGIDSTQDFIERQREAMLANMAQPD